VKVGLSLVMGDILLMPISAVRALCAVHHSG
jgi:hypothetical protein